MLFSILTACVLASVSAAWPEPARQGSTTKDVPNHPGLSLTFKQTYICETKAKAWAGYVHMPASYLADIQGDSPYNVSTFFWYFEARHDPQNAPTALYLAGGPGESSMFGATQDGGPCTILPDSNTTETNPDSFNEYVNMLYVDQPVSSGFSYSKAIQATFDLLYDGQSTTETGITPLEAWNGSVPAANTTFIHGVFPEQNPSHAPNNSVLAARTLWHFTQVWLTEFTEYKTTNTKISLWGNSYGGYWVTTSAAYFQRQNVRIEAGEISGTCIDLDTAGITNGCIDMLYQAEWYPQTAYNNTYDLEAIPQWAYEEALNNYTKPGGCRDLIGECRALGDLYDPEEVGLNGTVNTACVEAELYCAEYVLGAYNALSNRSVFDMSHFNPDPLPPYYTIGFMSQQWVQEELGAQVNFTEDSYLINDIFLYETGDLIRRAGMKDVEYLLDSGVKVALVYGDRDYRCPWLGVENLSLQANWTGAAAFRDAGYEEVQVNQTYKGGVTRQHDNLSFTRVFQSGHDPAYFQPETTYKIFNRTMFDRDIPTGQKKAVGKDATYSTKGPHSSYGWKETLPAAPNYICYLYSAGSTCTLDQFEALLDGSAEIVDFIVVNPPPGGGPVSA